MFVLILLNVNLIQSQNNPIDDNSEDMVSVRKSDRKFHQTKEELSFIKLEPRFDAEPCSGQSVSIFILSAATTSGRSYLKRQAERKTWVSEAKENNISVYFVIALSKNETTNQLLKEESKQYKDMIQMQFIDSYWNLTLKTLSILHWVNKNCKNSKLIIKADDDIVLNIDLLLHSLDQFEKGISGFKDSKLYVERDPAVKWWYPKEYYKPDVYPPLVFGGFSAITSDVIPKLLETLDSYSDTVLDLEDVFVTGILAEKAGVPRHQIPYMTERLQGCPLDRTCKMSKLIALVDCASGEELTQFYETWKKNGSTECPNTGSLKIDRSFVAHFICLLIIIEFLN